MGIRDLVAQHASKAKQFVTGRPSQPLGEQRFPEEAHGQLAKVEVPNQESRASQVAKATKNFINRQTSSTFKNATGYKYKQSQGKKILPDNVKSNIPRTRVPQEPQRPSFINRQIDLSYQQGEGYTSHIINKAFSFEEKHKPIFEVQGLPKGGTRGAFETAVGYKPKKEKKFEAQKFTITITPKKFKPKPL